jgi:hypothetical protein
MSPLVDINSTAPPPIRDSRIRRFFDRGHLKDALFPRAYVKKEIYMKATTYRRTLLALVAGAMCSVSSLAFADTTITAVPTAWRLQDYAGGAQIAIWYTGSSCTNGQLLVDPTWSIDQAKMVWSTVMAAKASQLPVIFGYTVNSSGSCIITSFGLDVQ